MSLTSRSRVYVGALALLSCLVVACDDEPGDGPAAGGSASSAPVPRAVSPGAPVAWDFIDNLHGCDINHRGLSLDLGTRGALVHRSYAVGPFDDMVPVQREGATFDRLFTRRVTFDFWLDAPRDSVFVSSRLRGVAASRVGVYIDGRRVGLTKLGRNELVVTKTREISRTLEAGRHTVGLRFNGRPGSPPEPYAEVDWIRIGTPDNLGNTYAAPTLDSVVVDIPIAEKPQRSLALRAPAAVRCTLRVTRGSRFRANLGFWGTGHGAAEIRLLRDNQPPVTLETRKVKGGTDAAWSPVFVDLQPHADELVALELRATETVGGGRVVVGEPRIETGEKIESIPEAKTVLIVLLAGVDRRLIPPWGGVGELSAFSELARKGAAFTMFRAPTTVASGVFASLLTGLSPRAHAVEDPSAKLPAALATVSEIVKQASAHTAMFTSVPTSFRGFGFNRGWDVFEEYSPVSDISATQPFDRAAEWLGKDLADESGRRFVIIYARGAHPPWDITPEKAIALPPEDYGGTIDVRRGAMRLAKIRQRRYRRHRRIRDDDWQRVHALQSAALVDQSAAFARVVEVLERHNAWKDALVLLAGDVGPGEPPGVPYDPAGALHEDRLLVPLVVKFPERRFAAKTVDTAATTVDIARTVLASLRLDAARGMNGVDLFELAAGAEPLAGRPLLATLGNGYSTRWGEWLLYGEYRARPKLCQMSIDPACVDNVLEKFPIVARAAWQRTYDAEFEARLQAGGDSKRVPATIEPDTAAALQVWGFASAP